MEAEGLLERDRYGDAGPEPLLHHGEVVYRNGEVVGDVRIKYKV